MLILLLKFYKKRANMKSNVVTISATEQHHLAENLKFLLKKKNITECDLARALDLTSMTVRRLLSGETNDPRILTLKMIADYFEVTLDALMGDITNNAFESFESKPRFLPVLDWVTAEKIKRIKELNLSNWKNWQPISLNSKEALSDDAFILESKPSMYPRFSKGTIFVIDPVVKPTDGDFVLIRMRDNNELTLRELIIDAPTWHLQSLSAGGGTIDFDAKKHTLAGTVYLTMFYNRKAEG